MLSLLTNTDTHFLTFLAIKHTFMVQNVRSCIRVHDTFWLKNFGQVRLACQYDYASI